MMMDIGTHTSDRAPAAFEPIAPDRCRSRGTTLIVQHVVVGATTTKATTTQWDIVGSCNALVTPGHDC